MCELQRVNCRIQYSKTLVVSQSDLEFRVEQELVVHGMLI